MRNIHTTVIKLLPAFGVWLILLSSQSFALTEQERQKRLETLRATIEQVKKELENVKTNRTEMLDTLKNSETKIGELNKKMDELKNDLEDKQSHLKSLRKDKESLSLAKKQQTHSASTHINAAYRLGNQSSIKLLLNQQSPTHVSRNLKYFDYIVKARNEKIERFATTLKRLNTLEPKIASDVAYIEHRKNTLNQKQKNLKVQQQERQKVLAKLNKSLASKDAKLEHLNKDRSHLETLVGHVAQAAQHLPVPSSTSRTPDKPFTQLKGKLPWPTPGRILHSYGSERVKGKMRWQGVLIGANEGAPVRAVHQGRVVFSDYLRGHGLLIIVDHGAGFMSLYAHNQTLHKQLGQWVEGGEHIASVGASGGQTTASLYFELRFKGEPTNPQRWLTRA